MSSRIEKMLAKSAGVRPAKDIPDNEIPTSTRPKTAVGMTAALQAAQLRIAELESGNSATLPVAKIAPNPWQPRRVFDEAEIQKLAASIAEVGLIQPVIVRRVQNLDTEEFQVVAGERRLRAHRLLGLGEIKAIVVNVPDEDMASLALAENLDREDLTAYEIAIAIRNAESAFPNRKRLAEALGIQRSDLYRYLSFFQLPALILVDLEQDPDLLGRDAAEQIAGLVKKHGDGANEAVSRVWTQVKAKKVDQGKAAELIEAIMLRNEGLPRADRDIRKLFVGKEQAGSITRDAKTFTVKIKTVALTPEKEAELRAFVERMFAA